MRLILLTLCLCTSIVANACTKHNATTKQSDPAASCVADGGQWIKVGRAQTPMCNKPYADAHKACSDNNQCEGNCITTEHQRGKPATGQCSASPADSFGCYASVENGMSMGKICVD